MLRHFVLEAIAEAADGNGEAPAWHVVAEVDPLLRPMVRRRVRRAWERALLAAPEPNAARHALRVAYLDAAGVVLARGAAIDDVARAYRLARARRGVPRRPPHRVRRYAVTIAVAAAIVVSATWLSARAAAAWRRAGAPPSSDASRRSAPAATGAFGRGGVPRASAVVGQRLGEALPAVAAALDGWVRAGAHPGQAPALALAQARLFRPELGRALGPRGVTRLFAVVRLATAAALATPAEAATEAARQLFDAVGSLDDELAAQDLGFTVDADVLLGRAASGRHVTFYVYRVERVRPFTVDGARARALEVRRVDRLNVAQDALGYARPHLRDALVQLDEIDAALVALIVPALASSGELDLVDDDARAAGAPWSRLVAERGAQAIRAELLALLEGDASAAQLLGGALARRHALFERWRERLLADGLLLRTPTRLAISPRERRLLADLVPESELAELDRLQQIVDPGEAERLLGAVRAIVAGAISGHEAQHRADFARPRPLHYPAALAAVAGPLLTRAGERAAAVRAKDELSAYLGQLARPERAPRLALTLALRFLFDRDAWGTPEAHAALVIAEGLRAELGLGGERIVSAKGVLSRARAAELYVSFLAVPEAELRAAAARLWERLFDATLAEIRFDADGAR
jgi:hypothetical protein